jgi:hypothetical protein
LDGIIGWQRLFYQGCSGLATVDEELYCLANLDRR